MSTTETLRLATITLALTDAGIDWSHRSAREIHADVEAGELLIYWDEQDPENVGWGWRLSTPTGGEESGGFDSEDELAAMLDDLNGISDEDED